MPGLLLSLALLAGTLVLLGDMLAPSAQAQPAAVAGSEERV
jgi:hypothetical protein